MYDNDIVNQPVDSTPDENQYQEQLEADLRACYKHGKEWRLEFGRLLLNYRRLVPDGWVKFVKDEFDLHRQTAWRWMHEACDVDGMPYPDVAVKSEADPDPDTQADTILEALQEAREEVEEAKKRKAPFRMIVDDVTDDERERFQEIWKNQRSRVQEILRNALDEILNPVVVRADSENVDESLNDTVSIAAVPTAEAVAHA
jgi:hypothetical protein